MHFDNCGLPVVAFDVYTSLSFVVCLAGALGNAYVGRTTLKGSILRNLSMAATATNVFFAALCADLLIYKRATVQSLVFYVLAVYCTCIAFSFLFLSVLLPVSRISRTIAARFIPWRRFWLYFLPYFVCIGLIIVFVGAYVFTPSTNKATYNNWLIGQAVLFMVLVAIAAPPFTSFTGILIRGLNQVLDVGARMDGEEERNSMTAGSLPRRSSTNDADLGAATATRQTFAKDLLDKVTFIRNAVIVAGIVLFSLGTLTFALQIEYGTVPLFWAIFISGPAGVSLFTLEIAWYTRKRRESEKRRSTMIPFLGDIGRHISIGIKRSSKRFERLGSSRDSDTTNNEKRMSNRQASPAEAPVNHRQLFEVPSTVKEEPTHFQNTWIEGRDINSLRVQFSPDLLANSSNNALMVVAADSALDLDKET